MPLGGHEGTHYIPVCAFPQPRLDEVRLGVEGAHYVLVDGLYDYLIGRDLKVLVEQPDSEPA